MQRPSTEILSPLDFDEVDVLPLSYKQFAENIELRKKSYKKSDWNLLYPPAKIGIQFNNVRLDGNILKIYKEGHHIRNHVDYYQSTSGTIEIKIEPLEDRIRLRASVRPELGLQHALTLFIAFFILVACFSYFVLEGGIGAIIFFFISESFVFLFWKISCRERHLALTQYYKNYLFNVANP